MPTGSRRAIGAVGEHFRRRRNHPLSDAQAKANRNRSKIRAPPSRCLGLGVDGGKILLHDVVHGANERPLDDNVLLAVHRTHREFIERMI